MTMRAGVTPALPWTGSKLKVTPRSFWDTPQVKIVLLKSCNSKVKFRYFCYYLFFKQRDFQGLYQNLRLFQGHSSLVIKKLV
jgi:hypothetical protein